MRNIPLLLLLLLVAVPAGATSVQEDPHEREMLEIANDLRCTVCQNEAVSESNADLARDMREIIREQLAAGKSREEVIDYFVARYGDFVLMKPPYEGAGMFVWLGPLVLFVLAAVSAFMYLRRRLHKPMPAAPPLSAQDAARVREAKRQVPE